METEITSSRDCGATMPPLPHLPLAVTAIILRSGSHTATHWQHWPRDAIVPPAQRSLRRVVRSHLQSASLLRRVSAASSSSACQPRPLGFTATVQSRPSQRRSHPRSTPHGSVSNDPTFLLLAFLELLLPPSNGDYGFICCAAGHAPRPTIQPSFGRCQPHAFNAASRFYPPSVISASLTGVLHHRAKPRQQCRASIAKR